MNKTTLESPVLNKIDVLIVTTRKRRRYGKAEDTPLSESTHLNDLWCTDYKGEFQMGNREYCYPLTITDYASRFLIAWYIKH